MESASYGLFATYNMLNPYHAVKWGDQAGLSEAGLKLSPKELKDSTTNAQDPYAWKQYSNWDQRCDILAENIKLAHVVCLQEVALDTLQKLQELTKPRGYELATAVYHGSSQPMQQFGNAILYNTKKVKLKDGFAAGILYGTGEKSRSAACALFQIGEKTIAVASVHLAGYFSKETNLEKKQESKKAGFDELKHYTEALELQAADADGIVIAGDFNEDAGEAELELYRPGFLKARGYQFDDNTAATEPANKRRIDWLCYKPLTTKGVAQLTSMGLEEIQRRASDHLMTGTLVEFNS